MRFVLISIILSFCFPLLSQKSEAELLLDKSIQYHDPENNWNSFADSLIIDQDVPGRSIRNTRIFIDMAKSYFSHSQLRNDSMITRIVQNEECSFQLEEESISSQAAALLDITCERSKRLRNYYTYLYGLPMKLKDPGTIIDPLLMEDNFNGEIVNVIRVIYDPEVGEDTWYFYFSKENNALIGYRFYHNEPENDGEYILLEGERVIDGIRIPAVRTWYVNKDGRLLGRDFLK